MKLKICTLIICTLIILSACEKVVHIDLNTTSPKLVVDGNLSNVFLSRSLSYYYNEVKVETGAIVVISDNTGKTDTLRDNNNGFYYRDSVFIVVPGRTYFLTIITKDGEVYHSFSTVPQPIKKIDTIYFEYDKLTDQYKYSCKFKDPPNVKNYYKVESSEHYKDGFVFDDRLTDNQEITITFQRRIHYHNSVTIYLKSIDKATYDFYRSLPNTGDFDQFLASPPANPISNISNGGLGCFSAYSVTFKNGYVK